MKLQAMIDKKKEIQSKLEAKTHRRDELEAAMESDSTVDHEQEIDEIRSDVISLDGEYTAILEKITDEQEYERIKQADEYAKIKLEREQGSLMHTDFADFVGKETDGNPFDALQGNSLKVPYEFVRDEILMTDTDMFVQMMMSVLQSAGMGPDADTMVRGTDRPRNRAVEHLIAPYQMQAFTAFWDVIPKTPTTDQNIEYPKKVWRTQNGADVVAENVAAAVGNYTLTTVTQKVQEIVAVADATKQALRDIPRLRNMLRGALRADARQKSDRMILGRLSDDQELDANNRLLANTDVLNKTEVDADKILPEFSKLWYNIIGLSYKQPNIIASYGGDWGDIFNATIDTDKDSWFDGRPYRLLNTPVVLSPAMAPKSLVGGAFRPDAIEWFNRQDAEIEVVRVNNDALKRAYHLILTMEGCAIIYEGRAFAKYEATSGNSGGWA